jgi:hypothetical protein
MLSVITLNVIMPSVVFLLLCWVQLCECRAGGRIFNCYAGVILLNVIMLSVTFCCYAYHHYAKHHYTKHHYADYHYVECRVFIVLQVGIMLSVVLLSVVAPACWLN